MKKETILVVGASGTVGSEIAKQLRAEGYAVRETTSDPIKAKASGKVLLNLKTGEGLVAAMEGVDRAFLLSPPGYADQFSMLSPLIQEAKRRGLQKVVLMTAMGANASDTTPFRRAELELERSGLRYNIIRPNWFLQNFNTFWLQGIREQRSIALPAGTAEVSFVDTRDVAAVAAKLLTSEKFDNQAFDLTGPVGVDHAQVAAAIGGAIGEKVTYSNIPAAQLEKGLIGAGLPADYVQFMMLIFGFLREGYNARTTSAVAEILGRSPRSLQTYCADYASAWKE